MSRQWWGTSTPKQYWLFLAVAILIILASVSNAKAENNYVSTSPPKSKINTVILDLVTRKKNFAVAEKWSIFGIVGNTSDVPIWITTGTSLLTIPTEILGVNRTFFSQFASFPTIGDGQEVYGNAIRINPGEKYVIQWYVDGLDIANSSMANRLYRTIEEFLFFKPDEYPFTATVHYWTSPPSLKEKLLDLTGSEMVYKIKMLEIEGSPLVLVIGAALGGLFAFIVRSFVSLRTLPINPLRSAPKFLIGLFSTMVFCAVGVILLERLAKSDFPVVIAVKDFWGAIAIGLVLEWWGLDNLRRSLAQKSIATRTADEPMPNQAVGGMRDESAPPLTLRR